MNARKIVALSVAGAAVSLPTAVLGAISSPAVAASPGCGFATGGSGSHLSSLCWIDMTGYTDSAALAPGGMAKTVLLPNGNTMSFTITDTVPAFTNFPGSASHDTTNAVALGTFGSALGHSWYSSVPGKPALYMNGGPGNETDLTLSNIKVTDPHGKPVPNFGFIIANAEQTADNEQDTYSSDKPLTLLEEAGATSNAYCYSTMVGVGSKTVSCGYPGNTTVTAAGNPILETVAPTTVSAKLIVSGGGEAVAFGVLVPIATTTTLAGSPDPSSFLLGSPVTLTSTVKQPAGTSPVCTAGTVAFSTTGLLGGRLDLGSTTTNGSAIAAVTTRKLPLGTDVVTATFTPNNTVDCVGSSGTTTQIVDLLNATLTLGGGTNLSVSLPSPVTLDTATTGTHITTAARGWSCTDSDTHGAVCTQHLDHSYAPGDTLPDIALPLMVNTAQGPGHGQATLHSPTATAEPTTSTMTARSS